MEEMGQIKYFGGIHNLRDAKTKYFKYEPWQIDELRKCAQDPIYFCENYMKIETAGGMTTWGDTEYGMWDFQKEFIKMMATDDNVAAKFPRQCGKCLLHTNYLTLKDETGNEFEMTIGELYDMLKEKNV